jgi:hypothetical protein
MERKKMTLNTRRASSDLREARKRRKLGIKSRSDRPGKGQIPREVGQQGRHTGNQVGQAALDARRDKLGRKAGKCMPGERTKDGMASQV